MVGFYGLYWCSFSGLVELVVFYFFGILVVNDCGWGGGGISGGFYYFYCWGFVCGGRINVGCV